MIPRTGTRSLSNFQCGFFYKSKRGVHWFHDYKYASGSRDKFELYNRQPEFGHGEITEHDRYPHLYWELWRGRTTIQRVCQQWGYAKDTKPEMVKRDMERSRYYAKLDALNFLEESRSDYSYLDSDAQNAVGYITDEEDDEIETHPDFGKTFLDAGKEYRAMVLADLCQGRPVYEWQVPYGLDEAYGYQDIQTAVDVVGNEEACENLEFVWEKVVQDSYGGVILRNEMKDSELHFVSLKDCANKMDSLLPTTIIMQCGAEKVLSSLKSKFSPTDSTDVYGCAVAAAWTVAYYTFFLPASSILAATTMGGLLGLNALFLYRTFLHPRDAKYKDVFEKCRQKKVSIVFGDWLLDDYDERVTQVTKYDNVSLNLNNPETVKALTAGLENDNRVKKAILHIASKFMEVTNKKQKLKKEDEVVSGKWITTFKDAVNNRRLDLIAHVINNTEGDKILMCVEDVDDVPADLVIQLLSDRLQGNIPIETPPLAFDEYFERVSVKM